MMYPVDNFVESFFENVYEYLQCAYKRYFFTLVQLFI